MGTEAEAIQSSPRFFLVSGDGSGLRAVDSAVGRIGSLACWEHYNPLARYALMADGEQIHSAMYPGSFAGDVFSEQISVNIRQHALESGCFVVNSTAWLDSDQQAQIMKDTGCEIGPISSGCFTAIVSPEGELMGEPLRSGEGEVIADLDFWQIDKRKRLMDSRGHYSRPHGRNGRDPAVDQEVCPDDVRRIVRREINCQLRDFQRIGDPLAWIVCSEDALNRIALLFACEATEHHRVGRAWA